MKQTIIFMAMVAFATAQFGQFPGQFPAGVEEPRAAWTGPLADHINGQLVRDTPEVAAAKAQHAQAHSQVLAVLPTLPPEVRYQRTGIVNPIVPQVPTHINNNIVPTHPNVFPRNSEPVHTSPQFTQFAEEIPRSSIGEVPEVHAARVAHLAAFQQAKAALPQLAETHPTPQHHQAVNQFPQQNFAQETPEVLAAKAAHARAFAAASNFGK